MPLADATGTSPLSGPDRSRVGYTAIFPLAFKSTPHVLLKGGQCAIERQDLKDPKGNNLNSGLEEIFVRDPIELDRASPHFLAPVPTYLPLLD